jgi:hypothetical protein
MKKLMITCAVAAIAFCGCKTTIEDHHRANLKTSLVPAKFKPTVEVMKEKGIVRGTAVKSYWFWFFGKESPDSFSHEIIDGFSGLMIPSVANAAIYDACKKSGASILLAPRFIEEEETDFLWFSGKKTITVEGVPARITGAEEIPVDQWPIIFGAQSGTQKILNLNTAINK